MNTILAGTHEARDCALFIDLPDQGWTMWGPGLSRGRATRTRPGLAHGRAAGRAGGAARRSTPPTTCTRTRTCMRMLRETGPTVRPAIDEYLERFRQSQRVRGVPSRLPDRPAHRAWATVARSRRMPPSGDYALISLDLDHFKDVNDTFGHAAGDVVLAQVADVLQSSVRDGRRRLPPRRRGVPRRACRGRRGAAPTSSRNASA